MKRNHYVYVLVISCLFPFFSCVNKPEKNHLNSKILPVDTPLVLSYGRFGVAEVSYDYNSTNIKFNKFNGNRNQFWILEKRNKGYVIRSYLNHRVLSINIKDSTLVQQEFNGNENQIWIISGKKDSLQIMNKVLNKFLTTGVNSQIIPGSYSAVINQQWSFHPFQKIQDELDSCNCYENFEFIKNTIESSYAGFQDKVNPETKKAYNELLSQTERTTQKVNNTVWCYSEINEYLKFFNDRHIHFRKVTQLFDVNKINNSKNNLQKNDLSKGIKLRNVDDSTIILTIPSFNPDRKAIIEELINNNRNKILSTPYLIIDIRNNGGGNDPSFTNILPLIYTNPYPLYGTDIIASSLNRKIYEETVQILEISHNTEYFDYYKRTLSRMNENPGKFVIRSEDRIVKKDSVLVNPRKVAILINRKCASSAEEFLLNARESKKVVLMGQPTSGTLDYSNVMNVPCPSIIFNFGYATTRSHRLPKLSIDKDKIKPDIYLSDSVDWMEEALKILKHKN